MADRFDNPIEQAYAMLRPIRNIDQDTITSMVLNARQGSFPTQKAHVEAVRNAIIQKYAKDNNLSIEDAQLLVDGALSNPYKKGKNQLGRELSYGMFESEPIKPNDLSGMERAKAWLKEKPEAYGVFHGYTTNDGEHFKLKNPIYFGENANLEKYDNAIGSMGRGSSKVKMQAFYRNQMGEEK